MAKVTYPNKSADVDIFDDRVLLSSKTSKLMVDVWKAGGLTLALIVVGIIFLSVGSYILGTGEKQLAWLAYGIGSLIFIAMLGYFIISICIPAWRVQNQTTENKELIDSVQEAALQMTEIINQFNSYALLHADELVLAIERARGMLQDIPIASRVLSLPAFQQTENLGYQIRDATERSKDVITDVASAIRRSDITTLASHIGELKRLHGYLEANWFKAPVNSNIEVNKTQINLMTEGNDQLHYDVSTKMALMSQSVTHLLVIFIKKLDDYVLSNTDQAIFQLDKVKNLLKTIPFGQQIIDQPLFRNTEDRAANLRKMVHQTNETVESLQAALDRGDMSSLLRLMPTIKQLIDSIPTLAPDKNI